MKRHTRREFLKMAGATAASVGVFSLAPGCAAASPAGTGESRRPNIIFILADDLGYGDLGCYGQKQVETPNIDRMAGEGMRFTQHYAGSTVCAPSRCSLMTGLHTGHCRVRANSRILMEPEDVTVAEVLKSAGYVTGLIGKWGVGHPPPPGDPARNGFDYFFGYLSMMHAHNYYPEFLWRNEDKVVLDDNQLAAGYKGEQGWSWRQGTYSHDLFTEEALRFVELNRNAPLFLYLAYTIPHANNEAGRHIGNGMEVPDYGIYKDKDWPEPQKGQAAMITRMDRDIGTLLAKLKGLGIDDNTLVMFSSDNGPHKEGGVDPAFFNSRGPLRGCKRDLYEGGIRVPLIARWPRKIESGSVTDHISAFWDFLPTAVELAGAKAPDKIDGISMVPTLLGKPNKQKKHEYLYWEFHERGGKQAVRMGDWKAVRLNVHKDPNGPLELYDLTNDIGEKQNVAAEHRDVIAKIEAYLKTARTDSANWPLGREGRKK
ncbi:MAG TPA: sulfatase-like hydrolase/transferase [Sedimentisphaerales bacterium]|nr:sulfatase-like hydrolase/transferase [Sedimentisphaerales bacterium]